MFPRSMIISAALVLAWLAAPSLADPAQSTKTSVRKKVRKKRAVRRAVSSATTAKTAPEPRKSAAPKPPAAEAPKAGGKQKTETFVVTPAGSLVLNDVPYEARPKAAAGDGFSGFTVDTGSIGPIDAARLGDVR